MVAETWILKMGNQVSSNLKHAFLLDPSKIKNTQNNNNNPAPKKNGTVGILSFEVANVMSKSNHLHKSLSEFEISKLKSETLNSQGISILISSDENHLLALVLAEKLDDLNRVAHVVSRLGKKFKDMDGMVKRMESFVNSTANLYTEMERQDVRHLKNVSVWNQTFDKVVELLARTVCTIFARILAVFGDTALEKDSVLGRVNGGFRDREEVFVSKPLNRGLSKSSSVGSGQLGNVMEKRGVSLKHRGIDSRQGELGLFRAEDFGFHCGTSPGKFLTHCLSLNSSVSRYGDEDDDNGSVDRRSQISGCCSAVNNGLKKEGRNASPFLRPQLSVPLNGDNRQSKYGVLNNAQFGPKSRLARYPHLVGEEARDDLYQMLPTSLRLSLRTNLKSYVKNLAIYDAPLAHDWKETLDGILSWLAPLAHNMIRWQSERNLEQQQIGARTNVLLLQTLYFADREKTEAAICELPVGLNLYVVTNISKTCCWIAQAVSISRITWNGK
ncbi:hypothetical protein F3Y22_tig00000538pilonHSYRG00005 [Hibiscus syriacus]|uniref:Uncharacterized protein n=1 Tax=Hibiscus syriacus TaxID=106335 RepID=A0A6A3CZV2_HIBSY|nr:hypothetical protein F3Y22_tig00000538pilonHSYRG00005 [Hibiscus syriacus]